MNNGKTGLEYLETFDALPLTASVVDSAQVEGGRWGMILDRTPFYPGGGGQPADRGKILYRGEWRLVEQVFLNQEALVVHVLADEGPWAPGEIVETVVDESLRRLHSRLHSAGHVIDMAVDKLGWNWRPTKAAHFPEMTFVEYEVAKGPRPEEALSLIQSQVDAFISAGSQNRIWFRDTNGHALVNVPLGHHEVQRVVSYDTFDVTCGGTHVRNISEIGPMVIRKIKVSKGNCRVSYKLGDTASSDSD